MWPRFVRRDPNDPRIGIFAGEDGFEIPVVLDEAPEFRAMAEQAERAPRIDVIPGRVQFDRSAADVDAAREGAWEQQRGDTRGASGPAAALASPAETRGTLYDLLQHGRETPDVPDRGTLPVDMGAGGRARIPLDDPRYTATDHDRGGDSTAMAQHTGTLEDALAGTAALAGGGGPDATPWGAPVLGARDARPGGVTWVDPAAATGGAPVVDLSGGAAPAAQPQPGAMSRAGGARPMPGRDLRVGDVRGLVDRSARGLPLDGPLGGAAGMQPGAQTQAPAVDPLNAREDALINTRQGIAEQRAAAAGDAARAQVRAVDAAQREHERIAQERQSALSASRGRYEAAVQRANEMRVDPRHWYSDRGLGGQIGASIAMALGSFAEALGAGPNRAAEIITAAVAQDVEAQRANATIAHEGAEQQRAAYWMAREQFDDADAAQSAAQALMLQRVEADVARRAAEIGTDEARASAEGLRVELERARQAAAQAAIVAQSQRQIENAERLAHARQMNARAMRDERRAGGLGAGGGADRPWTSTQLSAYDSLLSRSGDPEASARAVGHHAPPPGGERAGLTPQRRSEASAVSAALDGVERLIPSTGDDVPGVGLFDGNLHRLLVGDAGREMRQNIDNLVSSYVRLRSGAAATDQERAVLREALLGSGTEQELRNGLRMLRGEMASILAGRPEAQSMSQRGDAMDEGYGLTPADEE